ncbi:hypothetical protein SLA2020_360320 [Shorea laevis]
MTQGEKINSRGTRRARRNFHLCHVNRPEMILRLLAPLKDKGPEDVCLLKVSGERRTVNGEIGIGSPKAFSEFWKSRQQLSTSDLDFVCLLFRIFILINFG